MGTYDRLIQRLLRVNQFPHTVKMGLRNSHALHEAFGAPATRYDTIHVAGTNGKGSVSWKLAKALEASGFKTGLFVSPHVSCFRERIQVNSALISEAQVEALLPQIFNQATRLNIPATFFELTTILALQHFAQEQVDCVVLETGLGGRLDATNIVTPVLSVITSIGLDHTRILGATIPEIAREKAGIMKPNVPVVIGPSTPRQVMEEHAALVGAPISFLPPSPAYADDYDVENTAVATLAAVVLNQQAQRSSAKVHIRMEAPAVVDALHSRPSCRFEHVAATHAGRSVEVVLDVAHNLPAFDRLLQLLQSKYPDRVVRFVCGFSADKDIGHVIDSIVATGASHVHFVQGYHPRCASMAEIEHALGSAQKARVSFHSASDTTSSVHAGVQAAIQAAAAADEVVVVCGSVFIMSEARQALGFHEPVDSDELKRISGAGLKTADEREKDLRPHL
ncbi:Aste57867_24426 [Aphanomyces stellatus]|uniref:Aste57867_24426 protein n=1 Tax=Aphanomyces stellatus TaxID=120398 RepID=A0A485LQH4_9STRA|nr:hypothetical protein As57867_024350 [Aphanomyces stellatus]VFU01066.1 Aste57867_24426 [Aphanomyces stellatus]